MRLPVFKNKETYKRRMVAFGGINMLQSFSEGELADCEGISHDCFPALVQRRKSVLEFECEQPMAATFGNKECIAANSALYYDRKKVGKLSEGAKSIAQLGNKIVVFPDKVYYDTKSEAFMPLEGECNLSDIKVTFTSNKISVPQTVYKTVSHTESVMLESERTVFKYTEVSIIEGKIVFYDITMIEAQQLSEGDLFSEISGNSYYRIADSITKSEDGKISVVGEYITVKNIARDIFTQFSPGDIVEISGSTETKNNKEVKITEVGKNYLLFGENTFEDKTETSNILIKRKIPDLSCICSYKNRLWGCEGNTIYASALGDPLNFFKYENLSTDSFCVESNSAGDFTAATVYGNYCLFFKRDKCYKLYGDRPANFQLVEDFAEGVLKEDARSIVSLDGKIIYKGSGGIYVFYGGLPQRISEKLGNTSLKNCAAGGYAGHYYISADTENTREEYVYDIEHGLWSKSGVKDVIGYFSYGGNIYRLMKDGIFRITEEADDEHEWYVEFCPFDEDYYKTKNYSRIHIALQLFGNAWVKTEISSDASEWKSVSVVYGNKKEYINIPCPVKSCHEVKLRLSGKGKCIIESVVREFSVN